MSGQAAALKWEKGGEAGRYALGWARDYGIVVALALLCVFFSATTSTFLTERNLINIAEQSAEIGLIACGMTVVIIAGEFDLSVGAILGFTAVVAAFAVNEVGPVFGVLVALAAGASLGVINGCLVAGIGIQSFLATLATQFVFVGVAIFLTAGTNLYRVNDVLGFASLSRGDILGVQARAWIALAGFIVVWLILRFTRFGRQVYAVGGNTAAAKTAGVRVRLIKGSVFVVSGVLAGLAGAIALSDSGVAQGNGGVGTEFTAIAAVIIGGTSVAGGRGSVWRTLVGVLLLAVVSNGFTLLRISPTYDQVIQGSIILGAILLDSWLKRTAPR